MRDFTLGQLILPIKSLHSTKKEITGDWLLASQKIQY